MASHDPKQRVREVHQDAVCRTQMLGVVRCVGARWYVIYDSIGVDGKQLGARAKTAKQAWQNAARELRKGLADDQ